MKQTESDQATLESDPRLTAYATNMHQAFSFIIIIFHLVPQDHNPRARPIQKSRNGKTLPDAMWWDWGSHMRSKIANRWCCRRNTQANMAGH